MHILSVSLPQGPVLAVLSGLMQLFIPYLAQGFKAVGPLHAADTNDIWQLRILNLVSWPFLVKSGQPPTYAAQQPRWRLL